jgi:hypothetical protein
MASQKRVETADHLSSQIFAVNVLAPYTLTAPMSRPGRLIYELWIAPPGVRPTRPSALAEVRWNGIQAHPDSRLLDVLLAFAVARRWPEIHSYALGPGPVPTRMAGAGAPDALVQRAQSQAWLAVSDDAGGA